MRSFELNKLVRDGIFTNMQELGQKITYRVLSGQEKLRALSKKMVEEATEFDPTGEGAKDELADQLEAIEQTAKELGISFEQLRAHQLERREKRGGFDGGIYVERLDLAEDDPWADYYAKEPDRFKEVAE